MDIVTRFVRVAVAGVWAWLALQLTNYLGITFSPEQSVAIQAALMVVFTAIVNALVGILAKQFPIFEWLLGIGRSPAYTEVGTLATIPRNFNLNHFMERLEAARQAGHMTVADVDRIERVMKKPLLRLVVIAAVQYRFGRVDWQDFDVDKWVAIFKLVLELIALFSL